MKLAPEAEKPPAKKDIRKLWLPKFRQMPAELVDLSSYGFLNDFFLKDYFVFGNCSAVISLVFSVPKILRKGNFPSPYTK